jgi:hypothetical protein
MSHYVVGFVWNPEIHYRVDMKSQPLASGLSQMNPVHVISIVFKAHLTLQALRSFKLE